MTIEATVNDLVASVGALTNSVVTKRAVLDVSANNADASAVAAVNSANAAAASATAAAASAATATSQTAEITAFKTAATALNTSTTATQAVTNLLPDMLAKQDPARYPFRNKLPSLVLDFERQKAHRYSDSTGFAETPLASLMTFVRNSTATYTGPDGVLRTAAANTPRYDYDPITGECKGILIEEQRTNLKTNSDLRPSNVAAQYATAYPTDVVSIQGLTNLGGGIKLVESTSTGTWHNVYFSSAATTGTTYTYSAYAKSGTRSKIGLYVNGRVQTTVVFDLNTLTATSIATDPIVGFGCQAAGNGWVRCWVTFVADRESTSLGVSLHSSNTSVYYNGDGVSYAYFACPQLEVGAFPTSYIPTPATFTGRTSTATYLDANGVVQTAGVGVARSAAYDYDADGVLRPIGLLLETSATNQLLYSEQFDNANWGKTATGTGAAPVVTANYGAAPDGQTTADRVVFALNGGTTINDKSEMFQAQTTISGTIYTQSVWLKTTDASTKVLQLSFGGETPKLITVTGTWQRFSNTATTTVANRYFRLDLRGTTGTSDSADVLIWGAQQGVGSYPTSYIPTTTAQVTRAADTSTSAQATRVADDATLSGANFSSWYNQEQGTLAGKGTVSGTETPNAGTSRTLAMLASATSNLRLGYAGIGGSLVTYNGAEQAAINPFSVTAGTHKTAVSVKKNQIRVARDGVGATEDTSAVLPRFDYLKIGQFGPLCGHVGRLLYYPVAFTNEELQVLTSA